MMNQLCSGESEGVNKQMFVSNDKENYKKAMFNQVCFVVLI